MYFLHKIPRQRVCALGPYFFERIITETVAVLIPLIQSYIYVGTTALLIGGSFSLQLIHRHQTIHKYDILGTMIIVLRRSRYWATGWKVRGSNVGTGKTCISSPRHSGFGGLEVACWPLVPKFAGSHPAEAVGFLGRKKSSARLPSEGK